MRTVAIILAGGRGTRAGGGLPKQWRDLAGRSVAQRSVDAFDRHGDVDRIVLVVAEDSDPALRPETAARDMVVVRGGPTRDASVRAGLDAAEALGATRVLIHDAARPLVSEAVIDRVLAALDTHPGAAPGLPVTDALWHGADGMVSGTRDRDGLYAAQTPQGFRFAEIRAAHRAHPGGARDDVEVARAAGLAVALVPGETANLKITGAEDFARAERLLGGSMDIRTGTGFDVHAFGPGESVMLCGVAVPHDRALVGHSDADVGMHALADALYGALAEGDIGRHFPPTDPQWKGAPSATFLAHAAALAATSGFRVSNCDVTLICERPKIGPHAPKMREKLSAILGIEEDRVSVKATTSERLGFTGREEGIAALATATLLRP